MLKHEILKPSVRSAPRLRQSRNSVPFVENTTLAIRFWHDFIGRKISLSSNLSNFGTSCGILHNGNDAIGVPISPIMLDLGGMQTIVRLNLREAFAKKSIRNVEVSGILIMNKYGFVFPNLNCRFVINADHITFSTIDNCQVSTANLLRTR